jgi:hypothetical protein
VQYRIHCLQLSRLDAKFPTLFDADLPDHKRTLGVVVVVRQPFVGCSDSIEPDAATTRVRRDP